MIHKTPTYARLKSRFYNTFRFINDALELALGVRICRSPSRFFTRRASSLFRKCSLVYSQRGYWFLEPMPSKEDLHSYYGNQYWSERGGKNYGATPRDLLHYHLIKSYLGTELHPGKTFLNFGAGHGGISHLLWQDGLSIVNIEPSGMPEFYNRGWKTFGSIQEISDSTVDIIYGSHSLEHVQNLDEFMDEVRRVLVPVGIAFWEVPNAHCPSNGAQTGRVDAPHTYYFEKRFFEGWFSETILVDGFDQDFQIEGWKNSQNDLGTVIRALGKIKRDPIDGPGVMRLGVG